MIRTFQGTPVTVIFRNERQHAIFSKVECVAGDPGNSPWALECYYGSTGEYRKFAVTEVDQTSPNYWIAKSAPGEVHITVRLTDESDVLNSITVQASIPLPPDVISALMEPNFNMPTLYAMSEDDGFVATMMLSSDTGMYMRYSGEWHTLNPDAIDGLNVTEVEGAALDMFDQFDRAGQLVNISAMPRATNEFPPNVGLGTTTGPVAASSAVLMDVPEIITEDDARDAIEAAKDIPELQWFVARRIKVLGLNVEVPW